jgi:Skp family chaperone for outer membrane proteins
MEILNKNQRNSALWRLWGLGAIVLAIIAVMLFSMHQEYAGQGLAELEKIQRECEREKRILIGKRQDAVNENNKLEEKIKKLEAELKNPDKQVEILQKNMKLHEDLAKEYKSKYEDEQKKREKCEADLRAAAL